MADWKPDRLLGGDERLDLFDVHAPTRRDRDERHHRERNGGPQPAVVHECHRIVSGHPPDHTRRCDRQIDRARDAAPGVVGELIGPDVPGRIQIVRELVAVLLRVQFVAMVSHRS